MFYANRLNNENIMKEENKVSQFRIFAISDFNPYSNNVTVHPIRTLATVSQLVDSLFLLWTVSQPFPGEMHQRVYRV